MRDAEVIEILLNCAEEADDDSDDEALMFLLLVLLNVSLIPAKI